MKKILWLVVFLMLSFSVFAGNWDNLHAAFSYEDNATHDELANYSLSFDNDGTPILHELSQVVPAVALNGNALDMNNSLNNTPYVKILRKNDIFDPDVQNTQYAHTGWIRKKNSTAFQGCGTLADGIGCCMWSYSESSSFGRYALCLQSDNSIDISLGTGTSGGRVDTNIKIVDLEWHNIGMVQNETWVYITVDGYLNYSANLDDPAANNDHIIIGGSEHNGDILEESMFVEMDETYIFKEALPMSRIATLARGTASQKFYNPISAASSSTIDLLFRNNTGNFKATFGEGEDFDTFINWTDDVDNSPLNASVGACNISIFGGLIEYPADNDSFNICNSGCQFKHFTDVISPYTDTASKDIVYFTGCHQQTASGSITVNISCSSGTDTAIIAPSRLPICSIGSARVQSNFTVCTGDASVIIGISSNVPNSQRKLIEDFALDREYPEDLNIFNTDVFFNQSTQLWYADHKHEYYENGIKTITGNCSHNTDANFDNDITEQITIVNAPPSVNIQQVIIGSLVYNFTAGFDEFEFINGSWVFTVSIIDSDLDTVNISLYDGSKTVIASSSSSPLVVDASLLRDEDSNMFNITVAANDTSGEIAFASELFNVTDTSAPSCSGLTDTTITNNTVFQWAVSCADESFFSFNITCDNGHSFGENGLFVTSYSYSGSTAIISDTTCDYEFCDGHTAYNINIDVATKSDGREKLFDGVVSIGTLHNDLSDFTTNSLIDRETFTFKFDVPTDYIVIYVNSDDYIYIMDSKKYLGWLVTGEYWIDFENPLVYRAQVGRASDKEVEVQISLTKKVSEITFYSIGKKNCVSGSQVISAVPAAEEQLIRTNYCPDETTPETLMYIGVFFIIIVIWLLARVFIQIAVLNMIMDIMFIYFGMSFAGCHTQIGSIIVVFGIFLLIWDAWTGYMSKG